MKLPSLPITQVPSVSHMLSMAETPLFRHHRSALQCGVAVIRGDIVNPRRLNGTQ